MFWLGIDGGGTKTACVLYNDALEQISHLTLPTCHYAQAGFEGMRAILEQGVSWALGVIATESGSVYAPAAEPGSAHPSLTAASSTTSNPSTAPTSSTVSTAPNDTGAALGIGFAICGYGEGDASTRRIEQIVEDVAHGYPQALVNDVEAAWAAGLECRDGIAIIAGTGSIAFGVCGESSLRCGGWDYELGDEGSGGWLGKELLTAFTRQADGRAARGPLYHLVREALRLHDDFDIISWAQEHYANRSDVAALAPLVTQAAEAGDASARAILARAAQEEAELVRVIHERIFLKRPFENDETDRRRDTDSAPVAADNHIDITDAPDITGSRTDTTGAPVTANDRTADPSVPVTYIGGTFTAGEAILDPLRAALPAGCTLVAPQHEPTLGPVLILRHRLGL